jgi:hypothetical protein
MKNHTKAAQQLVRFLHKLEPKSKKLTVHSPFAAFCEAGLLPPDLNAAIASVELEHGVGMTDLIQVEELITLTPLEFCILGFEKHKATGLTGQRLLLSVASIYRDYIEAELTTAEEIAK